MQSLLIKKKTSQRTATTTSHRTQTNVQPQISSAKPYCELAVQYLIFVKTTVLRQHDSYPFAPIQILTGDIRKACVFQSSRLPDERRSFSQQSRFDRRFESSPESRGSQASGVLLVLFVQAKRIKPFPLPGAPRFSKPRFSSPQWRLRTNKIKTFPKGDSRFCKPRISTQNNNFAQIQLNSFPLRGLSAACGDFFFLLFVKYKK